MNGLSVMKWNIWTFSYILGINFIRLDFSTLKLFKKIALRRLFSVLKHDECEKLINKNHGSFSDTQMFTEVEAANKFCTVAELGAHRNPWKERDLSDETPRKNVFSSS